MKEYLLRVLIASAAVIAVTTYALFLNTRLSVGRYEVKKMGWRNSWAEFPKEPSKQVSNPPEKQTGSTSEQGKAESATVSGPPEADFSELERELAKYYPGKIQVDCKDLASVLRKLYPELEGKVDDVALTRRALQLHPELKGRVKCDDATSK